MDYLQIYSALALLMAFAVLLHRRHSSLRLPLPPGPKPLPILGNTLQVKPQHAWRQYHQWIKAYGPLVSLNMAGQTVIILGNAQVAQDILNKRSAITSNRPRMVMANELATKGNHILLRSYDTPLVRHQRMQAAALTIRAASKYAELYELETLHLLHNLLDEQPEPNIEQHLSTCNLAIVFGLVYGMKVETGEEQFLEDARWSQVAFTDVATPGAYLVDTFPVLNWLPRFLAPWKIEAEEIYARETSQNLENLEKGLQAPGWNFTKQFSASPEAQRMSRVELAYSLGIDIFAGHHTTTLQVQWFIVACLNFPACLAKAQQELDQVVGRQRLPLLSDKANLPYTNAMLNECLRWRTIIHGGFPHASTEEFEYNGYRIPKGAILLPQLWAIDQDETIYKSPEEFDPERWMDAEKDGPIATWGFGRRVCPGKSVAKYILFLNVARLMWGYDIKLAVDEEGKEVPVDPDNIDTGFNTGPLPFRARFEVRDFAEEVIRREWRDAEKDIEVISSRFAPYG